MSQSPYEKPAALDGLTPASVHVKNRNEFGFVFHKIIVDDAWEPTETFLVFCDLRKHGDERWTVHNIGFSDGVEGGFTALPEPVWVFGYETDGEIIVIDEQGRLSKEQLPKQPFRDTILNPSLVMLVGLDNGHAYSVNTLRTVWERKTTDKWTLLDNGIPQLDYYGEDDELSSKHGFRNISGFADNDIYACGGDGDLWHYDGDKWRQIELRTNATLDLICCGGDGQVYITTNKRTVLQGRGDRWKIIKQDITESIFESIAWHQKRLYISSESALYEVKDGKFNKAAIAEGSPYTFGFIDARDGVLLCSAPWGEMSYHDGKEWHKLIYRERPPRDPNAPTLLEMMKELMEKKNK